LPTLFHEPFVRAGVAAKTLPLHVRDHWPTTVFTSHWTQSCIVEMVYTRSDRNVNSS
jgi:hypothetical protein